jgi:hypothetical protein
MDRLTSTDYRKPFRPWPVSLANRLGAVMSLAGVRADLRPGSLIATARKRTGLHELGDPEFASRLARLCESLETEAQLHAVGRLMARENLIRILVNRLRIQAALKRHPEIDEQPVLAPIFVVGLQRTGTTLLLRLLASDPGLRYLASWEAINPAPMPEPSGLAKLLLASPGGRSSGNGSDPRIRMAQLANRALTHLAPDFAAIHPIEATGPEEECLLFDYDLMGTVPEATWRVPSFSAWLEDQDHLPAYRGLRRLLKYLAWQRPGGRWVLKTPQHLEHLPALFQVFPDARIVWTHRDPCETVASFCSMMAHAWGVFSDKVDPFEVAAHWGTKAQRMVSAAMRAREQLDPKAFLDVSYTDLVADPMAQIHRIYEFCQLRPSAEALDRMAAWRSGNPQHKHGRHRYRLEDFGLTAAEVEGMFANYRSRHHKPHE